MSMQIDVPDWDVPAIETQPLDPSDVKWQFDVEKIMSRAKKQRLRKKQRQLVEEGPGAVSSSSSSSLSVLPNKGSNPTVSIHTSELKALGKTKIGKRKVSESEHDDSSDHHHHSSSTTTSSSTSSSSGGAQLIKRKKNAQASSHSSSAIVLSNQPSSKPKLSRQQKQDERKRRSRSVDSVDSSGIYLLKDVHIDSQQNLAALSSQEPMRPSKYPGQEKKRNKKTQLIVNDDRDTKNKEDNAIMIPVVQKSTLPTALSTSSKSSGAVKKGQVSAEERLQGARFRMLNEQLYTASGKKSYRLFQDNPELFQVYHEGFASQVKRWPTNPVDVIIENLGGLPKHFRVADFGCGEAKIAASVGQKVFSFDLVAVNERVTACDMSNVPLNDASMDVAVFCLSLMGTNYADCIREAHRVLKQGGLLKVAEVVSRIPSMDNFVAMIECLGFDLLTSSTGNPMFVLLDFRKNRAKPEKVSEQEAAQVLQPCIYKRR